MKAGILFYLLKNHEHKDKEIVPVIDEENVVPYEKWIVSFSNSRTGTIRTSFREFFAQGFYEAYDIVMTYAEKQSVDIRWFKEKRNCGASFSNHVFIKLESFCTYCNKRFNHQEPIPCNHDKCQSTFCSRDCLNDHILLLHNSK